MKKQDRIDWILVGIILIGFVFYLLVLPIAIAWGKFTGRPDSEAFDSVGADNQVQEEYGGY